MRVRSMTPWLMRAGAIPSGGLARRGGMPRDGGGGGGGRKPSRNVLGGELAACSMSPMTGFFRNGCCDTAPSDVGSHTVCVVATAEFLEFSKSRGNDLSKIGRAHV